MWRFFPVLALLYLTCTFFLARPALHDESAAYYQYGANLLATGTYGLEAGRSDNFREPGYGAFLALALAPVRGASQPTQLRWIVLAQAALFLAALAVFLKLAQLPARVKTAFVALALLSPTLWGAHADIYSETIPISIAVVIVALASRADFLRGRSLAAAALLAAWLALTKLYLMYFFPLAALVALARRHARKAAIVPLVALLALAWWSWRGSHVDRYESPDHRTILQLAGKVYRPELWHLREEWKGALLASCCLNTCERRYGAGVCDKFTWTVSDNVAYQLMQDAKDHPERHDPKLLHEVLRHWAATLPMQLVASGLELVRIAFFEAAPVWPESPGAWRAFAQLWHVFGSLVLGALALLGARAAFRAADPGVRRAALLSVAFLAYHLVVMAQVTNVQRYSQSVLPYLYFLVASLALHPRWRSPCSSPRK